MRTQLGQFQALLGFDSADESQTNRAMACMACMQTVQTVTELCIKDEALRGPFERVLQPVMKTVLEEGVLGKIPVSPILCATCLTARPRMAHPCMTHPLQSFAPSRFSCTV